MGMPWFIGAIFILLFATITVAIFLSPLMSSGKAVGTWLFDRVILIFKMRRGHQEGPVEQSSPRMAVVCRRKLSDLNRPKRVEEETITAPPLL